MKVLVTGANGFLGSWVVKALLEKNHSVVVLHREKSDLSALKGLAFESRIGDVTDRSSVLKATVGVDAVIHVAAVIAYDRSQRALMESVNVQGTQNIIDACLANKVNRLVHTSSIVTVADAPHIKGAKDGRGVSNEDSPYNMAKYNLGYFETKRHAEQKVMDAAKKNAGVGFEAIVLNPGNVFGPGDGVKGSRKTHLKVARGEFPFYSNGGMSICHVEDVAAAHVSALTKGKSGERYIVAGDNLTIKECFTELAHAAGHEPPAYCLPTVGVYLLAYLGEALSLLGFKIGVNYERAITSKFYMWFDSSRARKELDYNPRPGKLALRESVQWCKEHNLV